MAGKKPKADEPKDGIVDKWAKIMFTEKLSLLVQIGLFLAAVAGIVVTIGLYCSERRRNEALSKTLEREKLEDISRGTRRLLDKIAVLEKQYDGKGTNKLIITDTPNKDKIKMLDEYFSSSNLHKKFWNDYRPMMRNDINKESEARKEEEISLAMKEVQKGGHMDISERFYSLNLTDENLEKAVAQFDRFQDAVEKTEGDVKVTTAPLSSLKSHFPDFAERLIKSMSTEYPLVTFSSDNLVSEAKKAQIPLKKVKGPDDVKALALPVGKNGESSFRFPFYIAPNYRAVAYGTMANDFNINNRASGLSDADVSALTGCFVISNRQKALSCFHEKSKELSSKVK